VVEAGTHRALLGSGKVYANLYQTQFGLEKPAYATSS